MSYDHKNIDGKWQKRWEEAGIFHAENGSAKEKCYLLVEFPYPSGAGLHVGHPRSYTAIDIIARKKRMEGKNVLFPMGWDAFGLPAENYAIKTGIHPSIITKQNIDNFRRQLQSMGFSFDWSREFSTTDSAYYKWTQWMFLEFFKAGLAYKAEVAINWCPKDKCGLANEEVVGGACERCGTPVEKKLKSQWMIAITKYADRLLEDLNTVDYLPKIKKQQEEWIGKSEGAEVDFELYFTKDLSANDNRGPNGEKAKITVFTTRIDTIFGATYLVLAPEHPWVTLATDSYHDVLENKDSVIAYVESVKNRTEIDRTAEGKEKTGVELRGVKAINPATGEQIPMFIADYVLPQYGTGAIMAVPAHDERDFEFAKKFNLPVLTVVEPFMKKTSGPDAVREDMPFQERQAAVCIVKHWSEDKYLCLKWKKTDWQGFVVGGMEAGEDVSATGLREIQEETGYKNIRFVRALPGAIHSQFYQTLKQVNRFAHFHGAYFELENGDQDDTAQAEKDLHDVVWVPRDEVADYLNVEDLKILWNQMTSPLVCFTEYGLLVNSGDFSGRSSADVMAEMIERIGAKKKTTYKLRDWVFSRQRYWGEPIPLVHCERGCAPEKDGWVAVPVEQLPVELPQVEKYEPTDNGESPLAVIDSFVNTTCPQCGGAAKRETDTMPNWAGSSWYFLRYADAHNDKEFASAEALKYWMPVDIYNGGMEHTTLHLLYSRFWNKFLFDRGYVPTSEPYGRRHSHGMINAEDGRKMSKSWGNVVNPDDVVNEHGADTLRVYEMFMGPFDQQVPWSTNGVVGVRRFLDRVMRMKEMIADSEPKEVTKALHKTIKKVTEDINGFGFNTAVSAMMIFVNVVYEQGAITKDSLGLFVSLLCPFAPHVANELAESMKDGGFIEAQSWPMFDPMMIVDDEVTVAVQVNGKMRGTVVVAVDASEEAIVAAARADENVTKYVTSEPKKVIVVKGKLVNFVV